MLTAKVLYFWIVSVDILNTAADRRGASSLSPTTADAYAVQACFEYDDTAVVLAALEHPKEALSM